MDAAVIARATIVAGATVISGATVIASTTVIARAVSVSAFVHLPANCGQAKIAYSKHGANGINLSESSEW